MTSEVKQAPVVAPSSQQGAQRANDAMANKYNELVRSGMSPEQAAKAIADTVQNVAVGWFLNGKEQLALEVMASEMVNNVPDSISEQDAEKIGLALQAMIEDKSGALGELIRGPQHALAQTGEAWRSLTESLENLGNS